MEDKKAPTPEDLLELKWEPGKLAQPLNVVIQFAENSVQTNYIDWYERKRGTFSKMGRRFRVIAIVLTALAGVYPLIIDIIQKGAAKQHLFDLQQFAVTNALALTNLPPALAGAKPGWAEWLLDPIWAAVLLAGAATLVVFDKFFGATSGWVRFALTAQQMTNALADFRLSIQAEKLGWGGLEPSVAQAQAAMGKVQDLVRLVHNIVLEETKAWAAEFAEVLRELDQRVQQAAKLQEKGVIQLAVTNGDQCPDGCEVSIDDRPPVKRSGKEAAFEALPGLHRVAVRGAIGGKMLNAERALKVGPGEIQRCELKLE